MSSWYIPLNFDGHSFVLQPFNIGVSQSSVLTLTLFYLEIHWLFFSHAIYFTKLMQVTIHCLETRYQLLNMWKYLSILGKNPKILEIVFILKSFRNCSSSLKKRFKARMISIQGDKLRSVCEIIRKKLCGALRISQSFEPRTYQIIVKRIKRFAIVYQF